MNPATFVGLGMMAAGMFLITAELLNLPTDAEQGLLVTLVGSLALFIGKTR